MNDSVNNVRRRLVKALGYLGIMFIPGLSHAVASLDTLDSVALRLAGVLEDWESAASVGREYLRVVPDEATVDVLVNLINSHQYQGYLTLADLDKTGLRKLLKKQRHEDFEAGRVVHVKGWILSVTEARLCALAAIV